MDYPVFNFPGERMRKKTPRSAVSGFLSALITVAAITAGTIHVARAAPPEIASDTFKWKNGAEVYDKICAYCHEPHVGTQVAPKIRGRDLPPAYIHTVVRNGNRAMPSFRASEIDDASLAKLAKYISGK
jgi:mono/diheme cytochrome c family protein